jgi:hypothetical protein
MQERMYRGPSNSDLNVSSVKRPQVLEIQPQTSSQWQNFRQFVTRAPWIVNMVFTTFAFLSCNVSISHITSYGPTGFLYFCSGTLMVGIFYQVFEGIVNWK